MVVCILLAAVGSVAGCAAMPGHGGGDAGGSAAVSWTGSASVTGAAASGAAEDRLSAALAMIRRGDAVAGETELQSLIHSPSFRSLAPASQYQALMMAGKTAAQRRYGDIGFGYLRRAAGMRELTFDDALELVRLAIALDRPADAVDILASTARRWPEQSAGIDFETVGGVLLISGRLPHGADFELLKALYAAHWKKEGGIEPSAAWRDLALLLLEQHKTAQAIEVARRVVDPYVLISMRADKRFDPLTRAAPRLFDIDAAVDRERERLEAATEAAPRSLALKVALMEALRVRQRYPAMLAVADDVIELASSTNFPNRVFDDYASRYARILNGRVQALWALGERDAAIEQLIDASKFRENADGNVAELLILADRYTSLERPQDALAVLAGMGERPSDYGVMVREAVRADAASQLGDTARRDAALGYLHEHHADAPTVHESALIAVNDLDGAERLVIEALRDPNLRQDELTRMQLYAEAPEAPRERMLDDRFRQVIARRAVQDVLSKVGRLEHYDVPDPDQ